MNNDNAATGTGLRQRGVRMASLGCARNDKKPGICNATKREKECLDTGNLYKKCCEGVLIKAEPPSPVAQLAAWASACSERQLLLVLHTLLLAGNGQISAF